MQFFNNRGLITALVLALSFCIEVKATKILIVGDDVGESMGKTLESLCPGSEVQNAAIKGTTAVQWSTYTSDVLKECKNGDWDTVYISLGGNDLLETSCDTSDFFKVLALMKKIVSGVENIIENIVPQADTYFLTGYCISKGFGCEKPSDYMALANGIKNFSGLLPDNVEVIDSTFACGGSDTTFSDDSYFQDAAAINLNSKGYCKVFTQPDVQTYLTCGDAKPDCESLDFDIHGLEKHCKFCADSHTWKLRGKKTCAWVRNRPKKRCAKMAGGVKASTACPIACGSAQCTMPECSKNSDWTLELKNGNVKNCNYLKKKTKQRCSVQGNDNTFGYESCEQCGICK